MRHIQLIARIMLTLLFSGAALAEQPPRELRAAFIDFPPYQYVDEAGQAAGLWIELSELVAAEAGYHLEWMPLPISRVYRSLISGDIDLWPGLADIPELDGAVFESDLTPLYFPLSAYHLESLPPVEDIPSLAGKSLILIGGFTYLGLLDEILADESTDIARTPTHRSGLKMLKMGRGDYLVNYDQPINAILAEEPMPELQRSHLVSVRGAFILSRQNENAEAIMQDLERAYRHLELDSL